jgi:ATP-dependent Lon protease
VAPSFPSRPRPLRAVLLTYSAALKEVSLAERVSIPTDVLQHIISVYASDQTGVRELKRCIETVVQKINMLRMYNSKDLPFYIKDFTLPFIVRREHIELFLKKKNDGMDDGPPLGMYI